MRFNAIQSGRGVWGVGRQGEVRSCVRNAGGMQGGLDLLCLCARRSD